MDDGRPKDDDEEKELPKPKGGRPRVPDRACLPGIEFGLKAGLPWEYRPREMGRGSGMTCWRRLHEWARARVRRRLHRVLLERLDGAVQIARSRAGFDSATVTATRGGDAVGPAPTDRGKLGAKRHLARDRHGIPLSIYLTAADVNEGSVLEAVLERLEPMRPIAARGTGNAPRPLAYLTLACMMLLCIRRPWPLGFGFVSAARR